MYTITNHEDALNTIRDALEIVQKHHNVEPEQVSVKSHVSGCYTIKVSGEEKYYFFNEYDLAGWIEEIIKNGIT